MACLRRVVAGDSLQKIDFFRNVDLLKSLRVDFDTFLFFFVGIFVLLLPKCS